MKEWVTDGYNSVVLIQRSDTGIKVLKEKVVDSWQHDMNNYAKALKIRDELNNELEGKDEI